MSNAEGLVRRSFVIRVPCSVFEAPAESGHYTRIGGLLRFRTLDLVRALDPAGALEALGGFQQATPGLR